MAKSSWVDFNEIKGKIKIADVVEHYGISLARKGPSQLWVAARCQIMLETGIIKTPFM